MCYYGHMIEIKNKIRFNKGFTLVELLIVIAIIGILSGVVLVSTGGAKDKAKRASVISTMSSILPELVTCQDDNGEAKNNAAPTATTPSTNNTYVCCTDNNCTAAMTGHIVKWPDISTKTGWKYAKPTGKIQDNTYQFTATNAANTDTITCVYADNGCN